MKLDQDSQTLIKLAQNGNETAFASYQTTQAILRASLPDTYDRFMHAIEIKKDLLDFILNEPGDLSRYSPDLLLEVCRLLNELENKKQKMIAFNKLIEPTLKSKDALTNPNFCFAFAFYYNRIDKFDPFELLPSIHKADEENDVYGLLACAKALLIEKIEDVPDEKKEDDMQKCYYRALAKQNVFANLQLARHFLNQNDFQAALPLVQKAEAKNDSGARNNLARLYIRDLVKDGKDKKYHEEQALKLYIQLLEEGNVAAIQNLTAMFETNRIHEVGDRDYPNEIRKLLAKLNQLEAKASPPANGDGLRVSRSRKSRPAATFWGTISRGSGEIAEREPVACSSSSSQDENNAPSLSSSSSSSSSAANEVLQSIKFDPAEEGYKIDLNPKFENLSTYRKFTRGYLETLNGKMTNAALLKRFPAIRDLLEDQFQAECTSQHSLTVPNVPVKLNGFIYDLEELLEDCIDPITGIGKTPFNLEVRFTIDDIELARDTQALIREKILKFAKVKEPVAIPSSRKSPPGDCPEAILNRPNSLILKN